MQRKFGALSSSVNPDQLANTVRGGILAIAGVIVYFGLNLFGVEITQGDITTFASAAGAVAGGVWAIYGLLQKLVVRLAGR